MPGGIQSKKGPAGTAKNARFSRIFYDSGFRLSLLIYITQHAKRQDKESSPIASSASRTGRMRFFYSRALLFWNHTIGRFPDIHTILPGTCRTELAHKEISRQELFQASAHTSRSHPTIHGNPL